MALVLSLIFVLGPLCSCGVDWDNPMGLPTDDKPQDLPTGGDYKYIALTFDDGPHYDPAKTTAIIDKLKGYGGAATFFVLGNRIDSSTGDVLKHAVDSGCEVGIHGYTHDIYFDVCTDADFEDELSRTRTKIEQYTGKSPTLFRPVGGRITDERVKSCGYATILWSVDSDDWNHRACSTAEEEEANIGAIVDNVLNSVREGDIVLFHDIYNNSAKAALRVIDELYDQGYRFVTVTELLGLNKNSAGRKYFSK